MRAMVWVCGVVLVTWAGGCGEQGGSDAAMVRAHVPLASRVRHEVAGSEWRRINAQIDAAIDGGRVDRSLVDLLLILVAYDDEALAELGILSCISLWPRAGSGHRQELRAAALVALQHSAANVRIGALNFFRATELIEHDDVVLEAVKRVLLTSEDERVRHVADAVVTKGMDVRESRKK